MTGKILNKKWNVNAKHPLYSETGKWYHQLVKFPGAFFDKKGYVLFKTREDYKECPHLQIGQDINIPKGISAIPSYVQIVISGKEYIPSISEKSEIKEDEVYFEGKEKRTKLTRYERDAKARKKCLGHYGLNCRACGFNFEICYGEMAQGMIEVHHLIPISETKNEYEIDPIKELQPVCPNCHAVIHRRNPPFKIEEIREMIARNKTNKNL